MHIGQFHNFFCFLKKRRGELSKLHIYVLHWNWSLFLHYQQEMIDSLSEELYRINLYSSEISRHSSTKVYNDLWKFRVYTTKTHDRTVRIFQHIHTCIAYMITSGLKVSDKKNPKSKNISGRKSPHSNGAVVDVIDQTTGIICNVDIFYDIISCIERNVFKLHSYLTNNEKVSSLMCLLAEDGRLNLWDMTSAFFNYLGPPLKINIRWRSY